MADLPACESEASDTGLFADEGDVVCVGGGPLGAEGAALQAYYAYGYDEGPYPAEMYEGTVNDKLVAQNAWDTLGRPVHALVLDGYTDSWQDPYTWEWDTDWLGALSRTTDPAGEVVYTYQDARFGNYGRPSRVVRRWSGVPVVPEADFDYEYDFHGNPSRVGWPGDAEVAHRSGCRRFRPR